MSSTTGIPLPQASDDRSEPVRCSAGLGCVTVESGTERAERSGRRIETLAEGVTLILGDCLAHLPIEADAVISDPPYGIGYVHSGAGKTRRFNGGTLRASTPQPIIGDSAPFDPEPWLQYPLVVLWGANHYASRLPDGSVWLAWDKHLQDLGMGLSFSAVEFAWTNHPGTRSHLFRHLWHGGIRVGDARAQTPLHPTQKPVELMAWCMRVMKVRDGATVLDPYMGSGSTGIACIRTGRKFIGIERDPKHFETAAQRIRAELAKGVLFPVGGGGAERQGELLSAAETQPNV